MIYINKALFDEGKAPEAVEGAVLIDDLRGVDTREGDFVFGTVRDMLTLGCVPLEEFSRCSFFDLGVSSFMPFIKDRCFNFNGSYFKQVCQLGVDDIGKFCRSDSGSKVWSGQILKDRHLLSIIRDKCQPDDMMFLAPERRILCEARFWMKDGKVVAKSPYDTPEAQWNYFADALTKYAEETAVCWEPDFLYTIDLAANAGGIYVMEYNCWSTSGFYSANIRLIIDATMAWIANRNGCEVRR